MNLKKTNLIIYFACCFFVWTLSVWAQPEDLRYKKRLNTEGEPYFEGIISKPLSSTYDIELISAMVNYYVPVKTMPERLGLQFYLERSARVHLRVQELDYKEYYRMDKEILSIPESYKRLTRFEWSTNTVIKPLGIDISNLGAVARLNRAVPSLFEEIEPVIFYHSKSPDIKEKEYLFIFRARDDAEVKCSMYKEESGKLVPASNDFLYKGNVWGEIWFSVPWNGSKSEAGYYQLKVIGYFLRDMRPIDQTVRFYYHKE